MTYCESSLAVAWQHSTGRCSRITPVSAARTSPLMPAPLSWLDERLHNDRVTRPACLSVKHPSGTFVDVRYPLWREQWLLVLGSAVILRSVARLPLSSMAGRRSYNPQEQGGPLMPPRHWVPFRRHLQLTGTHTIIRTDNRLNWIATHHTSRRNTPHRKCLFHYCVCVCVYMCVCVCVCVCVCARARARCCRKAVYTELFPSKDRCTVVHLDSWCLAMTASVA
jgi:hypothetical protein